MAINVNTVYNTVLSILNKEQRGYITPDEFNKLATQVQLEIFEGYFEDMNQQLRVPQTDNEYANRQKNIDDCISIFKTIGTPTLVPIGAVTGLSISSGGTGYSASSGVATTTGGLGTGLTVNTSINIPDFDLSSGGTGYSVASNIAVTGGSGSGLTVNITSVNSGVITGINIANPGSGYLSSEILTINAGNVDATITLLENSDGDISSAVINAIGSGYSIGDTVTVTGGNTDATLTISSINTENYFLAPSNLHRIGTVIYRDEKEIERITRNDFLNVNLSSLTRPTETFPVYLYEQARQGVSGSNTGQTRVYVYPTSITSASDIKISYIRKPADVAWGFSIGSLGQYVYSSTNSTQFELLATEQTEVILRILAYAGVVINDPQVIQAASGAVQAEKINSKS